MVFFFVTPNARRGPCMPGSISLRAIMWQVPPGQGRGETPDIARALGVGEGVEQAGVDDPTEGPAELVQAERVLQQEHDGGARSRAFSRAIAIARGAESTPRASCPRPARMRVFSPVPHPTSRTAPGLSRADPISCPHRPFPSVPGPVQREDPGTPVDTSTTAVAIAI